VGGRLVLRNVFLEGNTWQSSQGVDKNRLAGHAAVGVALVLKHVELTVSNCYRTREFNGQDRADS
jgi:hypothetical protein